jgi:hypothetical protein
LTHDLSVRSFLSKEADMAKESKVRLQVPVPADVADQIGELAERLEKPLATTAVLLLEESIDARKHFSDWLAAKLVEAFLPPRSKKGQKKAERPDVRLELRVSAEVSRDVEALAKRLDHTPIRMATLLLKAGVDENSGIIELMGSKIARKLLGKPPKGPVRVAKKSG